MLSKYSHLKYSREPDFEDKVFLSHTLVHMTSFQCARYLEEDKPLQVLRGGAGWFIGATRVLGLLVVHDSLLNVPRLEGAFLIDD